MHEGYESGGEDQETEAHTARIRALNDTLRQTLAGGRVLITQGVQGLPETVRENALKAIREFDNFEEPNDPYREHDFGEVEIAEEVEGAAKATRHKIWFKLDYYDRDCRFGSPDPADPAVTTRVMTILLPEEY